MLPWNVRNKKLISVVTIVVTILLLIRFTLIKFPYTCEVKAYIYRDRKWSESNLYMNLNYKHRIYAPDEFTGNIYLDDIDIMKYWKDYTMRSISSKSGEWNVKLLVYNIKNSVVDGEYQNSTFSKNYPRIIGTIYYKDFLKSIVITVNDYTLERKNGINYVDKSEMKPVIIIVGNVNLDDIKQIKKNDIILDNLNIYEIDDISIKDKINLPIFDIEFNKFDDGKEYAIEKEYKDFVWRGPSSYISDEDLRKTFDETYDKEYIKDKIAELENFKSGFINEVKVNKKSSHKEEDILLTEVSYDVSDGKLYSILLMKEGHSGYVVESVYTIKVEKDGSQKFISNKLGILSK